MQTTPRELPERAGPAGPALPGSAAAALTSGPLVAAFGALPLSQLCLVACALALALGSKATLCEVARRAPAGQAGAATGGSLFVTFGGSVAWPPAFGLLQRVSASYALCFTAAGALCAAAVLLASIAWRPDGGPAL